MKILIPMAGKGSRFRNVGFRVSKPFIRISGVAMFENVLKYLPSFSELGLIIQSDDEKLMKDYMKNNPLSKKCSVFQVNGLTEGQLDTCLKANEFIDSEDLLISASDNASLYDKDDFESLKECYDILIWTFRNNQCVTSNPDQYGWIAATGNRVVSSSIKKALSDNPMTDHAIVGTFWFKTGDLFTRLSNELMEKNIRVNGEYYVDSLIDIALEKNINVGVFEISHYIGWGTPEDLATYEYWQEFFNN